MLLTRKKILSLALIPILLLLTVSIFTLFNPGGVLWIWPDTGIAKTGTGLQLIRIYKELTPKGVLLLEMSYYGDESDRIPYGPTIHYFANGNPSSFEYYDGQGIFSAEYFDVDGKEMSRIRCGNGKITRYSVDGQLICKAQLVDGDYDGQFLEWHENGTKKTELLLNKGINSGKAIGWYNNGNKKYEGCYTKGEKEGKWCYYFINGNISEIEYFNPQKEAFFGTRLTYDENGTKTGEIINWDFDNAYKRYYYWPSNNEYCIEEIIFNQYIVMSTHYLDVRQMRREVFPQILSEEKKKAYVQAIRKYIEALKEDVDSIRKPLSDVCLEFEKSE